MGTPIAETPVGSARPKRSFWLYIPPPLLFVGSFAAGVQLDSRLVSSAMPAQAAPAASAAGIALIFAAGLMIVGAPLLFALRRTTIIPHAAARVLISSGPYRISRNPMYLALAIAYVGVALLFDVLWPLLLLPLPIWVMSTRVIPVEEHALMEAFGDEYRAYQRRVRRWI